MAQIISFSLRGKRMRRIASGDSFNLQYTAEATHLEFGTESERASVRHTYVVVLTHTDLWRVLRTLPTSISLSHRLPQADWAAWLSLSKRVFEAPTQPL